MDSINNSNVNLCYSYLSKLRLKLGKYCPSSHRKLSTSPYTTLVEGTWTQIFCCIIQHKIGQPSLRRDNWLFTHPVTYPSIHPSIHPSTHPFTHLPTHPPTNPSSLPPIHLPTLSSLHSSIFQLIHSLIVSSSQPSIHQPILFSLVRRSHPSGLTHRVEWFAGCQGSEYSHQRPGGSSAHHLSQ